MATKKILFQIEIDGSDEIIRTQKELADAVKKTNDELKQTRFGTDEYQRLEKQLAQLKATQKDVADRQRLVQNEFEVSAANGTKTYRAMNAELGRLRALYRELTEEERNSPFGAEMRKQIAGLDKELKDIDASIGNFQRNVGNYGGAFREAFAPIQQMLNTSVPGFEQLSGATQVFKSGIEQIGQAATASGKLITGAFVGFQVASLILDGVKAVREFSRETTILRGNIARLSNEAPEQVNAATSSVLAITQTFNAEQEELIQAANALVQNYGVSFDAALQKIESGYLAGADANGKWLDTLIEMAPKAVGAGASLDQFTVALTESGRAGLQEEEMIEGVIKRSAEFTGTVEDLIDTTQALTQKQTEQLAAERELAAAKVELIARVEELTGGSDVFFTELQTTGIRAITLVTDGLTKLWGMFDSDRLSGIANQVKNFVIGPIAQIYDAVKRVTGGFFGSAETNAALKQAQQIQDNIFNAPGTTGTGPTPFTGGGTNKALQIAQQIASRERQAAAKAAAEERKRIQDEANAAEARYYEERIALLNELSSRLAQAGIDAIQDQTAREIAEENARFEKVGIELSKLSKQQESQQLEARIKLVEAFGPNPKQVQEFDKRALLDVQSRREESHKIEQQELENHLRILQQIKNDGRKRDTEGQLKQIQASIEATKKNFATQAAAQAISTQEEINKVLGSGISEDKKNELIFFIKLKADKESAKLSIQEIDAETEIIKKRLDEIANSDTISNASTEEYELLIKQLDDLTLKRKQAEKEVTDTTNEESKKRKSITQKEMDQSLQYAQQVIQVIDTFQKAAFEADIARIEESEQRSNERIAQLEKGLQTATGAQKVELEKQLANEKRNAERIAKEKEQIEKAEAQRAKTFAIIQSIINTALAVTRALATTGPAGAILVGALGLAQTAVIAAQPAAEGAKIGSVPAQGNGLIVTTQNIPQLRNGDNVLATLKRGEVVLNKRQQALLGGAPTFRAIRVPGFAEGGAAGGIINAPDLSGITSAERLKQLEANQDLLIEQNRILANRIDRIQVYVVSEDIQTDLSEGDRLKTLATVG